MPFDLSSALGKVEDAVRRHFKSKAVQQAEKRRRQRKAREVGLRIGRGAAVAGASGAGMIGYAAAVAPMGTMALAATGAAAFAAVCVAVVWPSQAPRGVSRAELNALVGEAEEWLLQKRTILPGKTLPALDTIFQRLDDLRPRIADMNPASTLAFDLRRLLADHLPRLVHHFSELPETVRATEPKLLQDLIDGLATLDEELVRICREANQQHLVAFQAQEQFIEVRYRDGDFERR